METSASFEARSAPPLYPTSETQGARWRYGAGYWGAKQWDEAWGEGPMGEYSGSEMTVVAAARQLADGQVIFVGVGLPFLAAMLAQRTHAPSLHASAGIQSL